MGSERRPAEEPDEFEVSADEDEDLEAAMQEALEAVERGAREDAPGGPGQGPVEVEIGGPEEEAEGDDDYARLEAELANLRDRSVRTLADFENFRKRVARERKEELRYAVFDVFRDFLPVFDNLERALASDGPAEDLKAGVGLILRQMDELMRRYGISRVEAVGERFDPNVHEAVSRHEEEGVEVPTVSDEMQAGYRMHERLLRPAMVKVAMPPEGPEAGSEGEEAGEAPPEETGEAGRETASEA